MKPISTVTAGEAARRLGVVPATIQRWANQGLLRVERTAGGHRRIPIAELRRLIASSQEAQLDNLGADWLLTLLSGDSRQIQAALVAARQKASDWALLADEVASAIEKLGRLWEAGLCTVFEEHLTSEALRRATARLAEDIWRRDDAPVAALLTVEQERHTLGLSLAELVLAEAGWKVIWIGEGPPADELSRLVEKYRPTLLVVSASSICSQDTIRRYQKALAKAASQAHIKVILAGGGSWTWTNKRYARRVNTFGELNAFLEKIGRRRSLQRLP